MPVNQEMLKTAQKVNGYNPKLHMLLQNWEQQGGSRSAYPMSANSKVSPAALPEDVAKALARHLALPAAQTPDELDAAETLLALESRKPQPRKKLALDFSAYVPGASLGAGAGALLGGVGGALFPGKKKNRLMSGLRGALAGAGVGGLAGGALHHYKPEMISDVYDRLGKFLSGVKDDPKITALNKQLKREGVENVISDQNQLPARGEEQNWANTEDAKPDFPAHKATEKEAPKIDEPPSIPKIPAPSKVTGFNTDLKGDEPKKPPEQRDETYARAPLPKKSPGNMDRNPLYEGNVTPEMIERYQSKTPNAASIRDEELARLLRDYMRENPLNRDTGAEGYRTGTRGGFYPRYFEPPAFEE